MRTAAASIIGGTASVLGGGKFANGATTGAFVHLFNAEGKKIKNLEWDLDKNGILSLDEANNWYKNGKGVTIDVDASKLTVLDLEDVDIVFGIEDYLVHGSVSLAPNGGIYQSRYDFDIRIRDDFLTAIKNAGTVIGWMNAGEGMPYDIRFYGKPKVIKW